MTLVVDASVVVAGLVDNGPAGQWAADILAAGDLLAPHHLPLEVVDTLHRAAAAGDIPRVAASLARADLREMTIALFPFELVADRVWELRAAIDTADAWYVALAEHLDVELATLDTRLAEATGPRCGFRTPAI